MRRAPVLLGLMLVSVAFGCRCHESITQPQPAPSASSSTSNIVTVEVPEALRASPFDVPRTLRTLPNYSIAVIARIDGARFLATAPNGDIFVSQPKSGTVYRVHVPTETPRAPGVLSEYVSGLRRPHDIVFHAISGVTYAYISETHQVQRFVYSNEGHAGTGEIVVGNLPDSSSPELRGAYGHELKNMAIDRDHRLFVSIASTCNACASDTRATPVRGAIYVYDADGKNGRLFARGLRNAEGLAFVPGTADLWVCVNGRDNILYPLAGDQFGRAIPEYVDEHPVEPVTHVRDGGNYGWPFCNPDSDSPSGRRNMPLLRDVELNRDGAAANCETMDKFDLGLDAHTAPLGMSFVEGENAPSDLRGAAILGLHGSWNRTRRVGYKFVFIPWTASGPGEVRDLVSGWLDDATQTVWGRPVDSAIGMDGAIYLSDDQSGTVYRLAKTVTR